MGTHYKGTKRDVRAMDAYLKLMRAADTLESHSLKHIKDAGLTVSQFGVLETLLHLGPLQQSVISEKLLKSGGNITMVIDNLEKQELIRRVTNPEDRRCVRVHLTDNGRDMIASVFPEHVAFVASIMSTLSNDEQELLASLCRKLGLGATELSR